MDLNKAMIIGHLTKDPEVKTTANGISVTSFGVATNRVWTDSETGQKQERVEFHNVVAWRRLAEICGQYLRKGSKVYIEGRLQTRDWVGQDGFKRYTTEIVMENMIMLSSKNSFAPSHNAPFPTEEAPEHSGNTMPPASVDNTGPVNEEEIKVENIPF